MEGTFTWSGKGPDWSLAEKNILPQFSVVFEEAFSHKPFYKDAEQMTEVARVTFSKLILNLAPIRRAGGLITR